MRAAAVALLIEEHRGDIAGAWKRAMEADLGGDAAIGFAVGPLLRELALELRGDAPASRVHGPDGVARCAVLVRSGASASRVAREFKLLHRAIWETLRAAGRIVGADERRAVDEWLDDALAAVLERLDRVHMRIDLLDRAPATTNGHALNGHGVNGHGPPSESIAAPVRPPPLPRQPVRPPPLPSSAPMTGFGPGE